MDKFWLVDTTLRLASLLIILLTSPVSVPFIVFGMLEGTQQERNKAVGILALYGIVVGIVVHFFGQLGFTVLMGLIGCAIVGGFAMEISTSLVKDKKEICPDLFVNDLFGIDYLALWKKGFRLMVFDVDHTILPTNKRRLTVGTRRKLKQIQAIGFKVAFLSNTVVPWREKRIEAIITSAKMQIVSVCCNFFRCKPRKFGFDKVCLLADTPPEKAAMVGDMLGRDILGAQKAGYGYTILVRPKGRDNIWILRYRSNERKFIRKLEEFGHFGPKQ